MGLPCGMPAAIRYVPWPSHRKPPIQKLANLPFLDVLREPLAEERVVDTVEERVDVSLGDEGEAVLVEILNAGDGGIDGAVRAVGKAALEELVLEGAPEVMGGGGLEHAVGDGRDEKGARGGGAGLFADDDGKERKRAIAARLHALAEFVDLRVEICGKALDRYAVGPGAAAVVVHALPGVEERFGGEPGNGQGGKPPREG